MSKRTIQKRNRLSSQIYKINPHANTIQNIHTQTSNFEESAPSKIPLLKKHVSQGHAGVSSSDLSITAQRKLEGEKECTEYISFKGKRIVKHTSMAWQQTVHTTNVTA